MEKHAPTWKQSLRGVFISIVAVQVATIAEQISALSLTKMLFDPPAVIISDAPFLFAEYSRKTLEVITVVALLGVVLFFGCFRRAVQRPDRPAVTALWITYIFTLLTSLTKLFALNMGKPVTLVLTFSMFILSFICFLWLSRSATFPYRAKKGARLLAWIAAFNILWGITFLLMERFVGSEVPVQFAWITVAIVLIILSVLTIVGWGKIYRGGPQAPVSATAEI